MHAERGDGIGEPDCAYRGGVRAMTEEKPSVRLSEAEPVELIRDNARKLHVTIALAGQPLIRHIWRGMPDVLERIGRVPQACSQERERNG